MTGAVVEQALESLDESTRAEARAAIGSLIPEDGDWTDLLQITLQRFLWYELPVKWFMGSAHHHEIAWALGDLFEAGDLARYAAICRSVATHEQIARWESDESAARTRFRRMMVDSGVDPPDTATLTWGKQQGPVEYLALHHVSATLEHAVATGLIVPGRRGWRSVAAEVVEGALGRTGTDATGRTLLATVEQERLESWLTDLRRRAAPDEDSLDRLDELAGLLAARPSTAEVAEVAGSMEPVEWLLHEVGEGVVLTDAGYLPRGLALDADARYDWFTLKPRFTVRGERDLTEPSTPRERSELDAAVLAHLRTRWQVSGAQPTVSDVLGAASQLHSAAKAFGWFAETGPREWTRQPVLTEAGRLALRVGLRSLASAPRG